jgi:5-methylcytosine-specific restriction endonuclease McrA
MGTMERADACASIANDVDVAQNWVRVHEALSALARERANLEGREGVWLLRAQQSGVHRHLGFGSFVEYVDYLFGYCARTLDDKLRTARALQSLPRLASALSEGQLNWSAAKELARVATEETEAEWIHAARGKRARAIERLVSGRTRGDRPSDVPRPETERHVLRFEVSPETLATFREAIKKAQQDSGAPLDDDAALLLLARAVLERASESSDAGRASYQVAIMHCEQCGNSFQRAGAHSVQLEPEVAEMVACDAQRVVVTHVGDAPQRAAQDVPPAVRRHVMLRDHGKCTVPGCRHATFVDVHHIVSRADNGPHTADNLIVLCAAHHRAVHRGELTINGSVASGVEYQHADGTPYGYAVLASMVAVRERVLRGLIGLGFLDREARIALQSVSRDVVRPEELMRSALRALAPSRGQVSG